MIWKQTSPPLLATPGVLSSVFSAPSSSEPAVAASYACVAAFDFGRIASKRFFDALSCIRQKTMPASMLVAALDPDPVSYYQHNFGAVPAFDIDVKTSAQDFIDNLNWDPTGGGAESIACHAERLAIIADPVTFVILGEREFELGRLFVQPEIAGLRLQECLPAEWRYSQDDVLQNLLAMEVQLILARKISSQLI